jgi:hypothetical protein
MSKVNILLEELAELGVSDAYDAPTSLKVSRS